MKDNRIPPYAKVDLVICFTIPDEKFFDALLLQEQFHIWYTSGTVLLMKS